MLTEPITQLDVDEGTQFFSREGKTLTIVRYLDNFWAGRDRWKASDGYCYFSDGAFDPWRQGKYDLISRIPKEKPMAQVTIRDERENNAPYREFRQIPVDALFCIRDVAGIWWKYSETHMRKLSDFPPDVTDYRLAGRGNLCRVLPDLQLDLVLRNKD